MSYLAALCRQGATGVEVDATQGNISITFHQTPPVEPMRFIDGNAENPANQAGRERKAAD